MQIIETNIRFNGQLSNRTYTKYFVLHHAAHTNCSVYDVHQWHLNNGWSGIGYHFFISKDGKIYRGRPIYSVGAQCSGYNHNSIGICCEGNFEIERMSPEQKKAVAELLKYLHEIFKGAEIVGHSELKPTQCPGKNYPLAELKNYDKFFLNKGDKMEKEKIYNTLNEVPEWAKPTVKDLIESGALKGDTEGNLNITDDMIRSIIITIRYLTFKNLL